MSYPTRLYLVESLIPVRSITIISGSSGSGKSRLVFQLCEEWYEKATVLGRPAKPNPKILYLCYDRTIEDVYDTLNDAKIYLPKLTLISMLDQGKLVPPTSIGSDIDLVIVDGMDCIVDNINDFHKVTVVLQAFLRLTLGQDTAVAGIVGSTKLKDGERYSNSRERTLGSSAWGRLTGTHINIEFNEDDPFLVRKVKITPRNGGPGRVHELVFDSNNRLVPFHGLQVERSEWITTLISSLADQFSTSESIKRGERLGQKDSNVKKALAELVKDGVLNRVAHGLYSKIQNQ